MRKLNKLLRQAKQSCSRLWSLIVTEVLGRTTERRKPGRLSHRPGRRRVLDRSRGSFVVGFVAQRKMSTHRALLSVNRGASCGDAQEEEEYVRLVIVDLRFQDANMWNTNEQIARLPGAFSIDCQALFDGVSRSESSALGLSHKRSALESMALQISLFSTKRSSAGRCHYEELRNRSQHL